MFLELSSKSLYLTLEKEKKRKLLSSVHVLLKRDIKKFHFVVVQRWQRNVQKSVMHVQSCCFAVLFFCRSPCRRRCLSSQMGPTVKDYFLCLFSKRIVCKSEPEVHFYRKLRYARED